MKGNNDQKENAKSKIPEENSNASRNPISNSEFLRTGQKHNDPGSDRAADSERSGAGQQQGAGGNPIKS
jgi:hypothetical protein